MNKTQLAEKIFSFLIENKEVGSDSNWINICNGLEDVCMDGYFNIEKLAELILEELKENGQ